jgi:hypothetical protein
MRRQQPTLTRTHLVGISLDRNDRTNAAGAARFQSARRLLPLLAVIAVATLVATSVACEKAASTGSQPNQATEVGMSDTALGGNWRVRRRDVLPESSRSNTELWYGGERVAELVHAYRYYGDDCLAYSSAVNHAERFYFVCGGRTPMVLGPESMATWAFEESALQQQGIEVSATAIDKGSARIDIATAKKVAVQQGIRSGK